MKIEIKYELPIYSSTLEKAPIIETENMDVRIELVGEDEKNRARKILIIFNTVICSKHTSVRFTPKLFDSYDRIVELVDSEWLEELSSINQEAFDYWSPRHYVVYLEGYGMFQFIARGYNVIEYE